MTLHSDSLSVQKQNKQSVTSPSPQQPEIPAGAGSKQTTTRRTQTGSAKLLHMQLLPSVLSSPVRVALLPSISPFDFSLACLSGLSSGIHQDPGKASSAGRVLLSKAQTPC
ncbi:hypothetical protein DPEC_G00114260 [Dallia pectoralis]|uniref:Uncharacterized protein n=1 Tax=Dallia pectoralis TaxID=75939 RepID=A0ACC2GUM8_DALPE|nr:hypothetical protein DPEC_G00114260 [Dallia pectoralis]